jgi:hypothetical protein
MRARAEHRARAEPVPFEPRIEVVGVADVEGIVCAAKEVVRMTSHEADYWHFQEFFVFGEQTFVHL